VKRKAKAGNTGPCGTSTALTITTPSSTTVNGSIDGAVGPPHVGHVDLVNTQQLRGSGMPEARGNRFVL
jgi:hypothetical protein